MAQREISIQGARSHNLRDVSCRIPLRKLTVVTGVSGCGKSTLAFDTLYAEGQRRYVTSLSTYARQFLERLPRPDVDSISHLPPAIAIEQRNSVSNARSTVGTGTEVLDHLRVLFANIAELTCPDCEQPVQRGGASLLAQRIESEWEGERFTVAAPLADVGSDHVEAQRSELARAGHTRLLDPEGVVIDHTECSSEDYEHLRRSCLVLIDRLSLQRGGAGARLAEALAAAFALGGGKLFLVGDDNRRRAYREGLACDECGRTFPTPRPSLFSFNSPLGACANCQGFGRTAELDRDRVVPDPSRSLEDDAIAPFSTPMGREMKSDLLSACRHSNIPTDTPYEDLDDDAREFIFAGDEEEGGEWYGVQGFFDWLEGRRYRVQSRVLIARYRRFEICTECNGTRLCSDALAARVAGANLGDLSRLSLSELHTWLTDLDLDANRGQRSDRTRALLSRRLETVLTVGLGYLTLDRQLRTLSGGEAQRIQLATALGGSLTAALYVLDEPSVGLHPRDMARLLAVIQAIRDQGNTVVVVEHAGEIIRAADHVIDLGPGAGKGGGQIVAEGTVEDLLASSESATGAALREQAALGPAQRRPASGQLRIRGARANNLQNIDVELPLGQLVVVTGVSGAGKSTLIRAVLLGNLLGPNKKIERGECDAIEGADALGDIVVVDQEPAARSPRSNPATVTKAFEGIRKRFAATREAKALGLGPGWFSFNVAGGRCDQCEGAGEVVIDMQFMDDIRVPCEDCGGTRYRREARDIRIDDRSIIDMLALTIAEASEIFAGDRKIAGRLEPLRAVGLGYLTLGQPLSTLSGGEHQRVRLAQALADAKPNALYVLDEPTTGLHPADIRVLMRCIDQLIDAGGSVIVVEHNLDVIRAADHVIDLGPDGGPLGGEIIAVGTPAEIAKVASSKTGAALRGELGV